MTKTIETGLLKRVLCVFMCIILLTFCIAESFSPKARAIVPAAVAGVAGADAVVSIICSLVVSAVGVDFTQGAFDLGGDGLFGTGVYDVGAAFGEYVKGVGGDMWDWLQSKASEIRDLGGFSKDMSLNVPVEIAELAREWVISTYDFSQGDITITQEAVYLGNGESILLTQFVKAYNDYGWIDIKNIGTCYPSPVDYRNGQTSVSFTMPNGDIWEYVCRYSNAGGAYGYIPTFSVFLNGVQKVAGSVAELGLNSMPYNMTFDVKYYGKFYGLYPNFYIGGNQVKSFSFKSDGSYMVGNIMDVTNYITRSFTGVSRTDVLDSRVEEELKITLPNWQYVPVDGISIPAVTAITRADILADEAESPTFPTALLEEMTALIGVIDQYLGKPGVLEYPDITQDLEWWREKLRQYTDSLTLNPSLIEALTENIAQAIAGAHTAISAAEAALAIPPPTEEDKENKINWHRLTDIAIFEKFPFSLPMDVYSFANALSSEPKEPRFEFQLIPTSLTARTGISSDAIVLDFSEFEDMRKLFRTCMLVLFIIGLIFVTRNYIWGGGG